MATGFDDFFYSAQDGLKLHARVYGAGIGGPLPVVCLPGLTRNARDFHELALYLSGSACTKRKVVAVVHAGPWHPEPVRGIRKSSPSLWLPVGLMVKLELSVNGPVPSGGNV